MCHLPTMAPTAMPSARHGAQEAPERVFEDGPFGSIPSALGARRPGPGSRVPWHAMALGGTPQSLWLWILWRQCGRWQVAVLAIHSYMGHQWAIGPRENVLFCWLVDCWV